ncbi:MAG: 16S rRNA (guanine(966)-N(2))-methyltransferase RsmD [Clostridiales bacterium]|jgi:16S rRNA (guanine(966)-N(2))-methyltransferase RsmD|nr:16S rRNA (guanine(966)-N(2))-methyltransferase RsmD [Clostridiales bacterium]
MRVIAGKAKGHKLFSPEGLTTRPTADRIKESLFNVLMYDLLDVTFLDLYSGSGAIGIEALSRGAASAVFVDSAAESIAVINKNLLKTKLSAQAAVIKQDAAGALARLTLEKRRFDVIFMDPPYHTAAAEETVALICRHGLLNENGLIAVETAKDQEIAVDKAYGLFEYKRKIYTAAQIVFLRKE